MWNFVPLLQMCKNFIIMNIISSHHLHSYMKLQSNTKLRLYIVSLQRSLPILASLYECMPLLVCRRLMEIICTELFFFFF